MFSVYAQNPNFDTHSLLHLGEMPEGVVGAGQVRVQLKAASVRPTAALRVPIASSASDRRRRSGMVAGLPSRRRTVSVA